VALSSTAWRTESRLPTNVRRHTGGDSYQPVRVSIASYRNSLETRGLCARIAAIDVFVGCDQSPQIKHVDTSIVMPPRALAAAVRTGMVALLAGACNGGSPQPTVPTAVQSAPRVVTLIRGIVADMAFRRLADVRVEIVNGPNAGTFAISDPNGILEAAAQMRLKWIILVPAYSSPSEEADADHVAVLRLKTRGGRLESMAP
jgi:hypothetical protein